MDGWVTRPEGWNLFDSIEFDDNLIDQEKLEDSKYDIDHIVVLAGGLDNLGRNHPWVKDRLDIAYRLYQIRPRKIIILGGGTYHKPPHINRENYVIHECTMGAKYLINLGVKPDDIYREWASYDTIANGFYCFLNFVLPLRLKKIVIITSDFHMDRSKEIFNWMKMLWDGQVCKNLEMIYLSVSTKYLDSDIMGARGAREQKSLENLRQTIKEITTMDKFHRWFYCEHQAYNCRFDNVNKERIDEKIKASY